MALRDFLCLDCGENYEEFANFDETAVYPDVVCPKCQSKNKKVLMGVPNFNFANPVGTDRWCSESNGHDYRYKWNLPNIQKQRENAEKNSHMGPRPYANIDDISSGKHFGDVK